MRSLKRKDGRSGGGCDAASPTTEGMTRGTRRAKRRPRVVVDATGVVAAAFPPGRGPADPPPPRRAPSAQQPPCEDRGVLAASTPRGTTIARVPCDPIQQSRVC